MHACETAYRRVFDAWCAGEYANALELSREMLRNFPDHNIGWVLQGVILYELARYGEVEQVLHEAIQGIPLDHLQHGYIHLGQPIQPAQQISMYPAKPEYEAALSEPRLRKFIEDAANGL